MYYSTLRLEADRERLQRLCAGDLCRARASPPRSSARGRDDRLPARARRHPCRHPPARAPGGERGRTVDNWRVWERHFSRDRRRGSGWWRRRRRSISTSSCRAGCFVLIHRIRDRDLGHCAGSRSAAPFCCCSARWPGGCSTSTSSTRARRLPSDLGDPVLVLYFMEWGEKCLARGLRGYLEFWNAGLLLPDRRRS